VVLSKKGLKNGVEKDLKFNKILAPSKLGAARV
jgi:hypothetical protein